MAPIRRYGHLFKIMSMGQFQTILWLKIMKLITNKLAFMFLSIILYPLLHSAMNFCLKICFQQDPNFCMSMGQRYRYQRIPPVGQIDQPH